MGYPQRNNYANTWHHVMNRGACRQNVFTTDRDRVLFLALLADICGRYGIEIHAYCLMGNHYHLLVHCPEPVLGISMQRLSSAYTKAFNQRHGRDGALFKGRFASKHIEEDSNFKMVSRYIHRNPVADGFAAKTADYRWSSYAAYLGQCRKPRWLAIEFTLATFDSVAAYQHFVEGPDQAALDELEIDETDWSNPDATWW